MDDSAPASLPGALTLSREKYRQYFRKGRLASTIGATFPWGLRLVPLIGVHVMHWMVVKDHLEFGCLNPGKVINEKEGLVAAYTDLQASGDRSYPVIKVFRERLDLITHHRSLQGDKMATVSTYLRSENASNEGRWSDFSPYVVNCLVDDEEQIREAMQRLSPISWKALEMGLEQVEKDKPGLYPVDLPLEIVSNA